MYQLNTVLQAKAAAANANSRRQDEDVFAMLALSIARQILRIRFDFGQFRSSGTRLRTDHIGSSSGLAPLWLGNRGFPRRSY
jgi:hypothetical protein